MNPPQATNRANVKSHNAAEDQWYRSNRLGGLRRFAIAITILNILGHVWFGFEQSWAHPIVGVASAYCMEMLVELTECMTLRRQPRFLGGFQRFVDFFLAAHISGLACSMLLYANERLAPVAFASAIAIASKHLLRVTLEHQPRHFFNPSNLGITVTLLLFPWVGIAQPYQFTENLGAVGDWALPGVIVTSGTFLNACYTKRIPLIAAWLIGFMLQAVVRHLVFDTALPAALMPMSGVPFILYTFYMVTDPSTTPASVRGQMFFGAAVAATYGLLMVNHVVFGLFFALSLVSTVRGLYLFAVTLMTTRQSQLNLEHSKHLYRPRITFSDTNVVGNVYFAVFVLWQNQCRSAWMKDNNPSTYEAVFTGAKRIVITELALTFCDPAGASVGEDVEVEMALSSNDESTYYAEYDIRRQSDSKASRQTSRLAHGTQHFMIVNGKGPGSTRKDGMPVAPTGPAYHYSALDILDICGGNSCLTVLDMIRLQGKCRERFLSEHAPTTLRSITTGALALHTSHIAFHLLTEVNVVPSHNLYLEMRLAKLKGGRLTIQFDHYVASGPIGAQRLLRIATGTQAICCKRLNNDVLVPAVFPAELLLALRTFTDSAKWKTNIDETIEFLRHDSDLPAPFISKEKALAQSR